MIFNSYTINHQWRSKYRYGAQEYVTYNSSSSVSNSTRASEASTRATSTDYDYLIEKIAQLEARINELENNSAI